MPQTVRRSLSGNSSARHAGVRRTAQCVCTAIAALALAALPAKAQKITEVVADHVGSPDTYEYIEIAANPALVHPTGNPDTQLVSLSAYTLLEIDGSTDPGKILHVWTPGTTNGSGLWSTGYMMSTLEKPAFTILLVSGFSGALGDDLDAGDDGSLDSAPWSEIVDSVSFSDGLPGSRSYGTPVLGPSFDGVATGPGGASRFPYYGDTDSSSDWKRNDFDGDGLPRFTGTLAAGEAMNTLGTVNLVSLTDYYAGIDATSPAALRATLHARIANHTRFPYTSNSTDTWNVLELADEDPTDTGKILDIYKNASYTKNSIAAGAYNREHSWPNSRGFSDAKAMSEYTDCHHLFSSDIGYNSNRGNQPFGTSGVSRTENPTNLNHGFGGGSGPYPGNSNWDDNVVYEVWNHRRGDIARAQFYMDVRYEAGTHPYTGATEANLQLTDNGDLINGNAPYMGYLSVLLAWNAADPPDDAERRRNDIVESFQGNRNPFVDHPEWVSCVFEGTGCQAVTGGRFFTLAPCRVLDTRDGSVMVDGVPREVAFHEACGIPSTARALAANLTVTQPTLPGSLSVYPADGASTGTSVVHFGAGRTRASTTIIKLSDDGTGRARLEATVPTGGTVHVIVDVSGYFD